MSKEQFFGCKSSKLRKYLAGGLTAVFGSGMCSSCAGSAMQQSVIYKNMRFQENRKNLVIQEQLVLLLFSSDKFFLFYMMGNRNQGIVNQDVGNDFEEQQAVEDEFVMSPDTYEELMEGTNISRDLLSKVRTRGNGTVAMPESLYKKLLSKGSNVSLTGDVKKQQLTIKNSYLEKGKKIYNSVKENLVIVKDTLASLPEVVKENKWLLLPMGAALFYIVLQILLPILLAWKNESGEGKFVGDEFRKVGKKLVDEINGKIGNTSGVKKESSGDNGLEGLETVGKVVVGAGTADVAAKAITDIAINFSGEGSSENVENVEGPFLFVKNSPSKSSAKADNAKVSKKKKQSAVVPASAV